MRAFFPLFILVLIATACSNREGATTAAPSPTDVSTTAPVASSTSVPGGRPAVCPVRVEGKAVGRVTLAELNEISGAAASRSRPGVIWVHNDSGAEPVVYALSQDGELLDRVALPDLDARDWEDMAIGPGPSPGIDYLYLADIGDNQGSRESVQIHRIPEPAAGAEEAVVAQTLELTYPTGPVEAETLLVDRATGDMVIAGKKLSGATTLFGVDGSIDWSQRQEATLIGEIQLGTFAAATGGDADDTRVLIRTYDEVFQWERLAGDSLAQSLLSAGCRVASLREQQGEAIALSGDGFFTLSEGIDQPILLFPPVG